MTKSVAVGDAREPSKKSLHVFFFTGLTEGLLRDGSQSLGSTVKSLRKLADI